MNSRNCWQGPISTIPEGTTRDNPSQWSRALGVSEEALQLCHASDTVDLHIDSFIWQRIVGYRLHVEHSPGPLPGYFARQVDLPRLAKVGVGSAVWIVTTNPLRTAQGRLRAVRRNIKQLRNSLERCPQTRVVRNHWEYSQARKQGLHAAFVGVQGGNAFDACADLSMELSDGWLLRSTVVHLSNSALGQTSAPSPSRREGLTKKGHEHVEALNASRVFVDLAHIDRAGFFDAASIHDRSLPLLVTHTGIQSVHPHWRNLDDAQLRTVAEFGGTIGVMYHSAFLGDPLRRGRVQTIFRHLDHIVRTIGEDHASLGSDWDGAIVTPRDMPTCLELPRLVQVMLNAGWTDQRIGKVLGANFLRCLRQLRGAERYPEP